MEANGADAVRPYMRFPGSLVRKLASPRLRLFSW